jgi:hypothetical protein
MIIKKPCTVLSNAGNFNDHAFNGARSSELHGTIFFLKAWRRIGYPVKHLSSGTCRFPPIILYTQATNTRIITNDFGTTPPSIGMTMNGRSTHFILQNPLCWWQMIKKPDLDAVQSGAKKQ